MKLFTFIFTLIAAIVVYADCLINPDVNNYFKKRLYKDIVFYEYFFYKQYKDIPEVCKNELTNYNECVSVYGVLNSENYNEICPIITGDKCQKFYNDPISFIPSCKDSDLVVKIIPTLMKYAISQNKFLCQKDEAGNHCPISDLFIKTYYGSYEPSEDEFKKAKEKTCQSKICREVTYEYYTSSIEKLQILNDKSLFTLMPNVDDLFYKATEVRKKDILEHYIRLSNIYDSTECKAMTKKIH